MDVITVGLATKALVVGVERNDMRVHACKPVLLNVIGLRLGGGDLWSGTSHLLIRCETYL